MGKVSSTYFYFHLLTPTPTNKMKSNFYEEKNEMIFCHPKNLKLWETQLVKLRLNILEIESKFCGV